MLNNLLNQMKQCPVVAILRGITPNEILDVADILIAEGIRLIEVPMNSPDAVKSIGLLAEKRANQCLTGAGTVLTTEQVDQIADAGGQYIISPNTNPAVIEHTKKRKLISIPGFMTPTEGFTAISAGADIIKCFPVGQLGPTHIKDLKAVITTPIIAVGGVNQNNIADFMAHAVGVGIGSALYKPGKTLEKTAGDTKAFMSAIKS